MVEKTTIIEGVAYGFEYANHEFCFRIIPAMSTRPVVTLTPFELAFGDDLPMEVWETTDINKHAVMKVATEAFRFVAEVIAREAPYYFTIAANEKAKVRVYGMIARRIARKYGYAVVAEGNVFRFYREGVKAA